MPPFARREFSGNAVPTTITSTITAGDLTINIALATGWPTGATGPFIVTLDQGLATEEKVEILSRTGLVLTVTPTGRGHDNTAAVGHGGGAKIEHTMAARDLAEANAHNADTTRDDHSQYFNATRHSATTHAINTADLVDGGVTYAKLAAGQRHEPGDFKWSMQTADHTGWLKMDGRNTFSRVTYAALFAVVGTSLGAGVDGTTFGIGDVRKRLIMGQAASGVGSTLGGTGGTADAVAIAHSHTVNDHTHGGTTGDHDRNHTHGLAAHVHWVNGVGDHRHPVGGVLDFNIAIKHPAGANGLATSPAEKATFTDMQNAGGHDHGNTQGPSNNTSDNPNTGHLHPFTTGGASNRGTDTPGVSGTDQNLPPFLVMNGFIHI
jgi:Phage Tail Collar Domain